MVRALCSSDSASGSSSWRGGSRKLINVPLADFSKLGAATLLGFWFVSLLDTRLARRLRCRNHSIRRRLLGVARADVEHRVEAPTGLHVALVRLTDSPDMGMSLWGERPLWEDPMSSG